MVGGCSKPARSTSLGVLQREHRTSSQGKPSLFGLEVDGRMKTIFPTHQAAEKKARALKAEFPMLQIKVYDAAEKTRTLVELPPAKAIPLEEGN